MSVERTEFGYKRIVCACTACVQCCRILPGYLIPSDLRRIADRLGEPDIPRFALDNLLASPGAIVFADGEFRKIRTIVPARRADGGCRFLRNDRCAIHAEAPFGCSFFSTEQSKEESDTISARGYQAVKYLDHYAPGWSYEVRSVAVVGNAVAITVRISIPCAEGSVWREATGYEPLNVKGYGDPTSNAESMALRRAAAKFGLCLYLYGR